MQTDKDRKADTYKKIMLGGLVSMAELRELEPALLLGILVDGRRLLDLPAEKDRLKSIGDAEFQKKQKPKQ